MTAAVSGARLEGALLAAVLVLLAGCGRTDGVDVAVPPFPPARVEATLTAPTPSVGSTVLPAVTATVAPTQVIEATPRPTVSPPPSATAVSPSTPTPVPTPAPEIQVTYEGWNGKSVVVPVGGKLRIVVPGGYSDWTFDRLLSGHPLAHIDSGVEQQEQCALSLVPFLCNRTLYWLYRAVALGVAEVHGSRRICGEALPCRPEQGDFRLTVEVRP